MSKVGTLHVLTLTKYDLDIEHPDTCAIERVPDIGPRQSDRPDPHPKAILSENLDDPHVIGWEIEPAVEWVEVGYHYERNCIITWLIQEGGPDSLIPDYIVDTVEEYRFRPGVYHLYAEPYKVWTDYGYEHDVDVQCWPFTKWERFWRALQFRIGWR